MDEVSNGSLTWGYSSVVDRMAKSENFLGVGVYFSAIYEARYFVIGWPRFLRGPMPFPDESFFHFLEG